MQAQKSQPLVTVISLQVHINGTWGRINMISKLNKTFITENKNGASSLYLQHSVYCKTTGALKEIQTAIVNDVFIVNNMSFSCMI